MPPERSQNRAAAGLHGAKSRMSKARPIVAVTPRKNNATAAFFIIGLSVMYLDLANPTLSATLRAGGNRFHSAIRIRR